MLHRRQKNRKKKFKCPRLLAGWLLALCFACMPLPCQSTLNLADNLLQSQQQNTCTIAGRSGCEVVTTVTSNSNGLPKIFNSTWLLAQPWLLARASPVGWHATLSLIAPWISSTLYGTLQPQHKLRLAVELGTDQWDAIATSLGVLLQQLGFPSFELSPFGYSVTKFSDTQLWGFQLFLPWFTFVIDLLEDRASKLLNWGVYWPNWKWKWFPLFYLLLFVSGWRTVSCAALVCLSTSAFSWLRQVQMKQTNQTRLPKPMSCCQTKTAQLVSAFASVACRFCW